MDGICAVGIGTISKRSGGDFLYGRHCCISLCRRFKHRSHESRRHRHFYRRLDQLDLLIVDEMGYVRFSELDLSRAAFGRMVEKGFALQIADRPQKTR